MERIPDDRTSVYSSDGCQRPFCFCNETSSRYIAQRYRRSSEVPCLPLLVLPVVSLLPAQYSRYLFLQDPTLPSLTSLDKWRQCIDHSP